MTARKASADTPSAEAVRDYLKTLTVSEVQDILAEVEKDEFEVVEDVLVCHKYGGIRLSLSVAMPVLDRWSEINTSAEDWKVQLDQWRTDVIPAAVLEQIVAAAGGDSIKEIELCRRWSAGLNARLGKALY